MVDLVEEVILPSKGLIYGTEIKWSNRLRAPRLCDKGIGDLSKKNKLQASILDKTLVEPLGISAYDLHTADFLYLNFMQRQISKGDKPYEINIKCPHCGQDIKIDFQLKDLKIKYLTEETKPQYSFKTVDGVTIDYTFLTPRKIDDAKEAAELYKEEYPDADQDIQLQELLRSVILRVDGVKPTYSQLTEIIGNLYMSDCDKFITELMKVNFGLDLDQSIKCHNCNKKIKYVLPL